MSVELNLLVLMSECSDYKPVVPVGGCDNVLKSLNLTAHTHLRETLVPGLTCLHPELRVCLRGFGCIYTYILVISVYLMCL